MAGGSETREQGIERLKVVLKRLDDKGDGCVTKNRLQDILNALQLPERTVEVIIAAAQIKDSGRVDINSFVDWLYQPQDGGGKGPQPLFVATLNFLGNAYNPIEFMTDEDAFKNHYPKIREAFKTIMTKDVMEKADEMGFKIDRDALKLKDEEAVQVHFEAPNGKEFLANDNKVGMELRTNMITGGMLPDSKGTAIYKSLNTWRDRMKGQTANYEKHPQLVIWDIACNLVAEKAQSDYEVLCKGSYLNPDTVSKNIVTLLSQLPSDSGEDIICAVQEFPEEASSSKYKLLMDELPKRKLKHVFGGGVNASVAFIVSESLVVKAGSSPFGDKPDEVVQKIGWVDTREGGVDENDKKSLQTLARKTLVIELEAQGSRPAMRAVCAHSKEFKSEEGTKLMAKYLHAVASNGDEKDKPCLVMIDANTPTMAMSKVFSAEAQALGFEVLSKSEADDYITTRKKRSEMHGQFYDKKKCLKVVEAHKTFLLLLQPKEEGKEVFVVPKAEQYPDLKKDTAQMLPNLAWPTDHCMMRAKLEMKDN